MKESYVKIVENEISSLFHFHSPIDDTIEHSRFSIGHDTEYGYDKLRIKAKKENKNQFLEWLKGVITLLEHDLKEYKNLTEHERKNWEIYLKTLKHIMKLIKRRIRFRDKIKNYLENKVNKELSEVNNRELVKELEIPPKQVSKIIKKMKGDKK